MRKFLPLFSLLSFLMLFLLVVVFVLIAPGHYSWDTTSVSKEQVLLDILFLFCLIFNIICVLLSFLSSLQTCVLILIKKKITMESFLRIVCNLCPFIFLLFLTGGNLANVMNYFSSPFHMLRRLLSLQLY